MAAFVFRHLRGSDYDLVELYGGESWLTVLMLRVLRTRAVLVHHSNGLETRISQELVANFGADTHSGLPRRWYQPRAHMLIRQAFTRVDAVVVVSQIEFERQAVGCHPAQPNTCSGQRMLIRSSRCL
jgi:hypothetical protein